jgi:hypothetical protein
MEGQQKRREYHEAYPQERNNGLLTYTFVFEGK